MGCGITFWSDWKLEFFWYRFFWVRHREEIAIFSETFPYAPDWQPCLGSKWPSAIGSLKRCFVKLPSFNWHHLPSYPLLFQLGCLLWQMFTNDVCQYHLEAMGCWGLGRPNQEVFRFSGKLKLSSYYWAHILENVCSNPTFHYIVNQGFNFFFPSGTF